MPAPLALFPIITFIAKKGVEAAVKKYGKTAVKKAQDASKNQPTPKYMKDQKGPSIAEKGEGCYCCTQNSQPCWRWHSGCWCWSLRH